MGFAARRAAGVGRVELLAFAGTTEEVVAAVCAGAQAVAITPGFDSGSSRDTIRDAVRYCRAYGVGVYGILNSLANPDSPYGAAGPEAAALYSSGADGAIVNCMGALGASKDAFPDWPLWAGPGLAPDNAESAAALGQAGVRGIILPPELTLGEIAELAGRVSLEVIAFAHRELCAFYAGQCISPDLAPGRADPGRCDRWCRRRYTLSELGSSSGRPPGPGHRPSGDCPLSFKMLGALPVLRELAGCGVRFLAVDASCQGPERVAIVTSVYSAALSRLARGPGQLAVCTSDMALLAHVFCTELSTGYYERGRGASLAGPGRSRCFRGFAGRGEAVSRAKQAMAEARAVIDAGPARVPVHMRASAEVGAVFRLEVSDDSGRTACAAGSAPAEEARTAPLGYEFLHRQLSRLGDTPFILDELRCELDDAAIVPISDINDTRRRAVRALWEQRVAPRLPRSVGNGPRLERPPLQAWTGRPRISARVSDLRGAIAAAEAGAQLVCIGGEPFVPAKRAGIANIEDAARVAHALGAELYYATARIVHDSEMSAAREELRRASDVGVDGFVVANLGLLGLAAQLAPGSVVLDWAIPVADPSAWPVLSAMGAGGFIIPPWIGLEQARALLLHVDGGIAGVMAFGRVELGVSEHCVVGDMLGGRSERTACSAPCMRGEFSLRRDDGSAYPVRCDRSCRMHVFGCEDRDLIESLPDFGNTGIGRVWLALAGEPAHRVTEVCRRYVEAANDVWGDMSL